MGRRKHGEGSVYKRSDGRHTGFITLENGKRKYFYGKTEKEVLKKIRQAIYERDQGTLADGPQQKLGKYLEDWLEGVHKPSVRLTTYIENRKLLYKHVIPAIGYIQIQKLTPQHLRSLYTSKTDEEGLSAGSVRTIHFLLHKALANAVRWNLVSRNVADLVSAPRYVARDMHVLTVEQARLLLDKAHGGHWDALLTLAIVTGMRYGELTGLRWQDIDFEGASLQVRHVVSYRGGKWGFIEGEPKTAKSRRNIALPSFVLDLLLEHRKYLVGLKLKAGELWQDRDLVFPNRRGGFLDSDTVRRRFRKLLQEAGLPRMRFHDLRHSAATILLTMGVHPKVVQELLGHSSITLTMDTYSHVLPSVHREAMGKMGEAFRRSDE